MQIDIKFINRFQEDIYNSTFRNICGSGGFGNGKTTGFCQKILALACAFDNYRVVVFRQSFKDLNNTTRVTFFKVCPERLFDRKYGGARSDYMGFVRLINGSEIKWLHGDIVDENILRGLEPNAIFVDQAEEISEEIYDIMDGRVGRWDKAIIPDWMDKSKFKFNESTQKYEVPSFMLLACNPDDISHFIYRKYHPESDEFDRVQYDQIEDIHYKNSDTHIMFQASSEDNPALSDENKRVLRRKGAAFVRRFYLGEWGIFEGQVHEINALSILDNFPENLYDTILSKGMLFRILDHGTSSPTVSLWFSLYKQWLFCFREYYVAETTIKNHRAGIATLSADEVYEASLADPAIFKKNQEKYGGFWSTSDDYYDSNVDAPPLYFHPADNNEIRTRNAIDEALAIDPTIPHPITGEMGSPELYFIKKSPKYPNACVNAISETRIQKRKKIGEVNGQPTFSDKRVDKVPDHAYDCVRYMCGHRTQFHKKAEKKSISTRGTFYAAQNIARINQRGLFGGRFQEGYGIQTF